MGISETWLKSHKDAELNVDGYQLYRADRKRKRGGQRGRLSGGVAMYVNEDIANTIETSITFSNGVIELIGLYSASENLFIATIYRQPDDRTGGHRSTAEEFKAAIEKLSSSIAELPEPTPNIIIGGDFNLPHAVWPECSSSSGSSSDEKSQIETMKKFMDEHFLQQHINGATHSAGNTLDLVLTNNSSLLHSFQCHIPLASTSDHYIVECQTQFKSTFDYGQEVKPDLISELDGLNFFDESIMWDDVICDLQTYDWPSEFLNLTHDEMLIKFTDIIETVAKRHVPAKASVRKKSRTKIPRVRRNLMRKRSKLHKKLQSADLSEIRQTNIQHKLVNIEILLQDSYKSQNTRNEQHAVDAIRRNPKYFFGYAKKYLKTKSKIGPLLNENNEYTPVSKEMAEILRLQYESVFSDQLPNSVYTQSAKQATGELNDISFDCQDIIDAIGEIASTSSSGPDGVPAILLNKCKEVICVPLYTLWRKSLDMGTTCSPTQRTHIIPIHKGDHKGLASNYRPIALTSHISKIFEKVLRNKIVHYMESNNLFNLSQHGFRQGRSCLSQLLCHYEKILSLLEQGLNVDTIYLDFAKAFDKVDHKIILEKLALLGIGGNILNWIHSFLNNRTQHVLVNGFLSQPSMVKSGVPQGSVIGPLLFLIMIGDIDAELAHSFLSSFADDTRTLSGISSIRDASLLQTDLEYIYKWAEENNMTFNSKKLELLRYGSNEQIKLHTTYQCPDGSVIPEKTHVRDLGVMMSNTGDFKHHISTICDKARDMCSWILRTFKTREPRPMKTLWKSLVLPILDYCSQLYCPIKPGQIQEIEMIQQSFTRKIKINEPRSNYWERLSKFHLLSLQRRRERYRILYIWKIIEHYVPNISCDASGGGIKTRQTVRNGRTCILPRLNQNVPAKIRQLREASLPYHGSQLFNALPVYLRNISGCGLDMFKIQLDTYLQKIEDVPLIRGYTNIHPTESNSLISMIPQFERRNHQDQPPSMRSSPDLRAL